MSLELDVQVNSENADIPARHDVETWVEEAIRDRRRVAELTVRIVDEAESRALNERFRRQDKPTNVLSFPAELPAAVDTPLLGDIVICAPVVAAEATASKRSARAHWAHLVIHGTLHLLGFDHQNENQAREMEAEETAILTRLGFSDPYHELQ